MAHWVNTYPHTVYASVLLKDGKIIDWKIGQRKWTHIFDMARMFKRPFNQDDYAGETVESIGFDVNNSEGHNRVFSDLAREWFKQWEISESLGNPPYRIEPNYFDEARKLLPKSNCLKRHYACVIVSEGRIIATGYNKSLEGCTVCARLDIAHNTGDYAECQSVHAETSALINAPKNRLKGAELYLVCADEVDPIPCATCAKLIKWAGVKVMREVER